MRLVRSFAASAMAVGMSVGMVGVAGPAAADTPGCVTRAEFGNVSRGMNIDRVHKIFDTKGDRMMGGGGDGLPKWQERWYVRCDNDPLMLSWAKVRYVQRDFTWRVGTKAWTW